MTTADLALVLLEEDIAVLLRCKAGSTKTVQRLRRAKQLPDPLPIPGRPRWSRDVIIAWLSSGTGKLHWKGETDRSIRDALQQVAETLGGNRTVVSEAADWLEDYLKSTGGSADSADVKREGAKAGHGKDALQRARVKLKITTISVGFPRRTH